MDIKQITRPCSAWPGFFFCKKVCFFMPKVLQNAKDDDVATMLDDMKRMGFIDYWEAQEVED